MDTFANYILNEKDLAAKIEILYYLAKKEKIYFNKSVIIKTELARLFLKYNKLDLDENLILTACLLCSCKKIENSTNLEEIRSYAKRGAEYLETLGFDKKFCKICEGVNRYSQTSFREKESDVLELVEQFGGMILDRPERIGLEPDEAMVLLIHRNLKNEYNRYVEIFSQFIDMLQEINMGEFVEIKALKKLVRLYNETGDLIEFIKKIVNVYEPQIDKQIENRYKEIKEKMLNKDSETNIQNNRPLFTEETTRKILKNIEDKKQPITSN